LPLLDTETFQTVPTNAFIAYAKHGKCLMIKMMIDAYERIISFRPSGRL